MKKYWILDNLLTLLKGDDGKLRNKYIDNLPNVKDFKVIIQGENIELAKLGIRKSVKSHLEVVKYLNKPINRYFEHRILRLQDYRDNPRAFWALSAHLLRSKVFVLVHLNRVEPRWYRSEALWRVIKVIKELKRITLDFKGNIDLKRVYIPKTTGPLLAWALGETKKWRPLGVPTLPWRIYLSMLNTILVIWLEPYWHKEQHGYFPRKGTLTVWRSILKRISKPDIYEFDLSKFFPSVEIPYLSHLLTKYKTPKWYVEYIENLNKSKPKLAEKDEVDEQNTRDTEEINKGIVHRGQKWYGPVREFIQANGEQIWHELLLEDTGGTDVYHEYEFVQLQWALLSSFKPHQSVSGLLKELPQGGGISPTLSVQVLEPLFREEEDVVMYADDGLIFGKPKFKHPDYKLAGIKLNKEKSGWIKRKGKWLKPLKFCGLIYDGNTDTLTSQTNKGKTITITKGRFKQLRTAWELFTSDGYERRNNTWYELMVSRISGFVQSCLYNGTFNLSEYWDRWELSSHINSWQKSKMAKRYFKRAAIKPNLYNSSSVACLWFMNKSFNKKKTTIGK